MPESTNNPNPGRNQQQRDKDFERKEGGEQQQPRRDPSLPAQKSGQSEPSQGSKIDNERSKDVE